MTSYNHEETILFLGNMPLPIVNYIAMKDTEVRRTESIIISGFFNTNTSLYFLATIEQSYRVVIHARTICTYITLRNTYTRLIGPKIMLNYTRLPAYMFPRQNRNRWTVALSVEL